MRGKVFLTVSSKLLLLCPAFYGQTQNFAVILFVTLLDLATTSNTLNKEQQTGLVILLKFCVHLMSSHCKSTALY